MKTVIINGSPRKNGYTSKFVEIYLQYVKGDVSVINAYESKIKPCTDCRYCWKNPKCIFDDMSDIYRQLENADIVVFATPVYFFGVPAPLKGLIDRFQVYYANCKRDEKIVQNKKTGIVILTGGAKAFEGQFDSVKTTLEWALKDLRSEIDYIVTCDNSDNLTDKNFNEIKKEVINIAHKAYNINI